MERHLRGTSTHTKSLGQNTGTSLLYCLIADVFWVQGEASKITEITEMTKYTIKIKWNSVKFQQKNIFLNKKINMIA